jgi:hypothetical protein
MRAFLWIVIFQIAFSHASQSQGPDRETTKLNHNRQVLIFIERTIEESKTDDSDPVDDIKKIAMQMKFDWSKIEFYTVGFRCPKIYFILQENSKDRWENTEAFTKILLQYQRLKKFRIADTRNLKENRRE